MSDLSSKIDNVEKASKLYLKGYNIAEISRELNVSYQQAKDLVEAYKELVKQRVEEDPDFLDRIADNTLRAMDEINLISKEAWEVYDSAKELEMINQMGNTLKLAMELAEKKAKLLQLLGAKIDMGNTAKMRRLEMVNELISNLIKELISQCDHCKVEGQIRLAEVFRMMERAEQLSEARELTKGDYVEAEIIDG